MIISEKLAHKYLNIKEYVLQAGYAWEIDWQDSMSINSITESDFLRETAWVIISSGFKESIARKIFPSLSEAFLNWSNAQYISFFIHECRKKALEVFSNMKKIDAICQIIQTVKTSGFELIKLSVIEKGIDFITTFPFIGPITGLHLLKNIGIDVVKPDRHLARIASITGYESAYSLCKDISEFVGDSLSEIDLVLWRYATINKHYLDYFENI